MHEWPIASWSQTNPWKCRVAVCSEQRLVKPWSWSIWILFSYAGCIIGWIKAVEITMWDNTFMIAQVPVGRSYFCHAACVLPGHSPAGARLAWLPVGVSGLSHLVARWDGSKRSKIRLNQAPPRILDSISTASVGPRPSRIHSQSQTPGSSHHPIPFHHPDEEIDFGLERKN